MELEWNGIFLNEYLLFGAIVLTLALTEIIYFWLIKDQTRHENVWIYSIFRKLFAFLGAVCIIALVPAGAVWIYNHIKEALMFIGVIAIIVVYFWINKVFAERLTKEWTPMKLKKGDKLRVIHDDGGSVDLENGEIVTYIEKDKENEGCIRCKTKAYPHGRGSGWLEWRFEKFEKQTKNTKNKKTKTKKTKTKKTNKTNKTKKTKKTKD